MFSIVYSPVACAAKNGTFTTIDMIQSQEVDVIFGPICSTGMTVSTAYTDLYSFLIVRIHSPTISVNAILLCLSMYRCVYNVCLQDNSKKL